jgi:hypothetical protein
LDRRTSFLSMFEARRLPCLHVALLRFPEQNLHCRAPSLAESELPGLLKRFLDAVQARDFEAHDITVLHCTAVYWTGLDWTALHCAVLCCAVLHLTALPRPILYCTTCSMSYNWSLRARMKHSSIFTKSIGGGRSRLFLDAESKEGTGQVQCRPTEYPSGCTLFSRYPSPAKRLVSIAHRR